MRMISPLLKRAIYPSLSMAGIFHRIASSGLAVVTYHGVLPEEYEVVDPALDGNLVTAKDLRQQLGLLKAHYNVIAPEDFLSWRRGTLQLPERAVLIASDDGLSNCLTAMLPVLKTEGVKCLFFVTGVSAGDMRGMLWYEELFLLFLRAPVGTFEASCERVTIRGELSSRRERRAAWWSAVKQLSQVSQEIRESILESARNRIDWDPRQRLEAETGWRSRFCLLDIEGLRELISSGMTIGAHTLNHPMLSQAPPDLAWKEIAGSKAVLEAALRRPVWAFAYPFGDPQSVTPQVLEMAQRAGFDAAFLNFGGGLGTELPPFAIPRVHVSAEMSLPEFEAHVSGFYMRVQRRARASTAGVHLGHMQ